MALRTISIPRSVSLKRSDASSDIYSKVDGILKDLRTYSRRFGVATTALQDELRVLERLYYKGRNQHRSAIFWRKVVEIRKFVHRLVEIDVHNCVNSLRYSFYGDHVQNKWVNGRALPIIHVHAFSPKILKGSWTHVPDAAFLRFFQHRTLEMRILADTVSPPVLSISRYLIGICKG